MAEQNEVKCLICGGTNVIVWDAEMEIVECQDCNLTVRPLRMDGESAKCISSNTHKE